MAIQILDRKIERIFIIDDDKNGRNSFKLTVEETEMEPVPQDDGIQDLNEFLKTNITGMDGIVSDHHLKKRKYFPENGARVVYESYERRIPAVLVTRYEQADINEIRKYRKNIPTILTPMEFNPDSLIKSLELCINEFNGKIATERKAFRTLIRIDDVVDSNIFIFIPSWDRNTSISVNRADLPIDLQGLVKPDMRLHAEINIGAENAFDLYFTNWELK